MQQAVIRRFSHGGEVDRACWPSVVRATTVDGHSQNGASSGTPAPVAVVSTDNSAREGAPCSTTRRPAITIRLREEGRCSAIASNPAGEAAGGISAPAGRLLERGPQLAALGNAVAAVTAGDGGQLVLIGGEAGAGKSALTRHFCAGQVRATRILWGACDPLFTPRALGPLLPIAETTAGALAELVTRGARPYEVVSALVEELDGVRPTVLVIEDVHWADQATLDVVRLLARRVATTRALVVVTYRDDELGRWHPLRLVLGEIATGPAVRRLHLAPLSRDAVAELAADRPGHLDVDVLHHHTGGNPFFVTEALATDTSGVPATVRDAVLARAARLEPAARQVLDAVAVVPAEAELWLVERMVDRDDIAPLDDCVSSGILVATAGGVAFRHELGRLAVEESLLPDQRRRLHRAALRALAEPTAGRPDPARLAHHAEAAHDASAVLAHAPVAAARAAAVGAHREAAAHHARALRFADGQPAEVVADLHERRAHECYLIGQFEDAIAAQEGALASLQAMDDPRREGEARSRLARYRFYRGDVPRARQQVRAAVALLEQLPPSPELAWAYSSVAMIAEDLGTVEDYGRRAAELAARFDALEVRSHALTNVGFHELLHGRADGRGMLDRALEIAVASRSDEAVVRVYSLLLMALVRMRAYDAAAQVLPDALEFSTERDLASHRVIHLSHAAMLELDRGRWDAALAAAQSALRERTRPYGVFALPVIALVRGRRGEPDAWEPLDVASRLAPAEELLRSAPVAAARAEIAWLEGRHDAVVDATEDVMHMALDAEAPWAYGPLVYWRWRVGLHESLPGAVAEPYRAQIHGDWRRAAELWDALGCPYEAALARADADEPAPLRAALDVLQRLGAKPASELVARRLRELGVRGLPRGPRPTTRQNPETSRPARSRCWHCCAAACTTGRSPNGSTCPPAPSTTTCRRSCASWTCAHEPRPPPKLPASGSPNPMMGRVPGRQIRWASPSAWAVPRVRHRSCVRSVDHTHWRPRSGHADGDAARRSGRGDGAGGRRHPGRRQSRRCAVHGPGARRPVGRCAAFRARVIAAGGDDGRAAPQLRLPPGVALRGVALYGLLNFGGAFAAAYYALSHIQAGLASTLIALVPLATLLLAVVQRREHLRVTAVVGGVLALAGVALVSKVSLAGAAPPLAVLAAVAGVVCMGQAAIVARGLAQRHDLHPVVLNAVGMAVGAVVLLAGALVAGDHIVLPRQPATWWAIGYVVLGGSIGVFMLYLVVLRHWEASRAAYLTMLMPPVAVALSSWLDHEPITTGLVFGGGLILAGVYVGAMRPRSASPTADTSPQRAVARYAGRA
ncbi:MAG TPA: EamA family transporter [Euzebyales bacterium]